VSLFLFKFEFFCRFIFYLQIKGFLRVLVPAFVMSLCGFVGVQGLYRDLCILCAIDVCEIVCFCVFLNLIMT